MSYFRVNERCNGCLACVENCPADALSARDAQDQRTLLHNMARCARCGNCWRVCPQDAIEFQHLLVGDWDAVTTLPLVRCEVCNAPIDTDRYTETVSSRLGRKMKALCPRHREGIEDFARAAVLSGGKEKREVLP